MVRRVRGAEGIALGIVAAVGGCSIIYDPDRLGSPEDAQVAVDATPGRVAVVAQTEVVEGLGVPTDESVRPCGMASCDGRRAPLVILSSDDDRDGGITVRGASIRGAAGAAVLVDELTFDSGRRWKVLALRVPVSAMLVEQPYTVELAVTTGSGDDEVVTVPMQGLAELELASGAEALRPRYAKITVPSGTIARSGSDPVRLVSTSDLIIDGHVSVDAALDRPGAGGCAGGTPGVPGGCGIGAGQNAPPALASAGGGGFAGVGEGLAPGKATGRPSLVPFGVGGNTGNGGGAHGDADGGPGAGAIELSAGGAIRFGAVGQVTAVGATAPAFDGFRPGGGSGGAIMLRAGVGVLFGPQPAPLVAIGGGVVGVRGADGRIRVDSPAEQVVAGSTPTPAFWGAAWTSVPLVAPAPVEVVFRRARQHGQVVATPISLDGAMAPTCAVPAVDALCTQKLEGLEPGLHTLCLHQEATLSLTLPENATCVTFVSL